MEANDNMDIKKIIEAIEKIAPLELCPDWDNSGFQIDIGKQDVKKVLIALEITSSIIHEAKEKEVDLIVVHHPLLFDPIKKIDKNTVIGSQLIDLINADISVYAAHMNFDLTDSGNIDYLVSKLKLKNVQKFAGDVVGSYGELSEMISFDELCRYVKTAFDISNIDAVGNNSTTIKKVGICCGAGFSVETIEEAFKQGCDVFISGDVKHHEALYARERGICLIDAGHYGTEKFFVQNLAEKLDAVFGKEVEVIKSELDINPFLT